MEKKKIKALLERYYSGESSIEEEYILRSYFTQEIIDDEFIADKDIFLYSDQESNNDSELPDHANEIWNNIQSKKVPERKSIIKLNYYYLRIAAGILILLSMFFFVKNQVLDKKYDVQFTDTYNNPDEAYQEAKEALLYVSAMLNKGAGHMDPINKVSKGTKQLYKLTAFNNGLKELSPINTYNVTNKYFKQ